MKTEKMFGKAVILIVGLLVLSMLFIACQSTGGGKETSKQTASVSSSDKRYIDNTPEGIERAIEERTKEINLDRSDVEAWFYRGLIYINVKKDYDKAIADFTQVIRLSPDNPLGYFLRGLAYSQRGQNKDDYDKAISDWEMLLKVAPDFDADRNPKIKDLIQDAKSKRAE